MMVLQICKYSQSSEPLAQRGRRVNLSLSLNLGLDLDLNIKYPTNQLCLVNPFSWSCLIIPNSNNDTSRVDATTRLIAVNMPNNNRVGSNWKNYRVSVDAIEAATGYDLLSRLPLSLQTLLEARAGKSW